MAHKIGTRLKHKADDSIYIVVDYNLFHRPVSYQVTCITTYTKPEWISETTLESIFDMLPDVNAENEKLKAALWQVADFLFTPDADMPLDKMIESIESNIMYMLQAEKDSDLGEIS